MQQEAVSQIVEKAQSLGATLAGIVGGADLRGGPSARAFQKDESWLRDDQSVLVLALEHPVSQPELDWWGTESGTQGNHQLKLLSERVKLVLQKEFKIKAQLLQYQPRNLSVFLKDAAVLAGLGCMGANNLLITPQYGPRIRLRGLLLNAELPTTPPALPFSPCEACDRRCWKACPQQAFGSGVYDRLACRAQMGKDELNRTAVETPQWGWITYVKYCRACELACPLGDTSA
jgi:epoxyqueuosine reductase